MKILNQRQKDLAVFVKIAHAGQKRKYTGEPYMSHPLTIAKIALELEIPLAVEVALLHDVVEDTEFGISDIREVLDEIGYDSGERIEIFTNVRWLTNRYTHEDYPERNRAWRKEHEAIRLSKAPALAQTIKYLDIAHNLKDLVKFDPKFAAKYAEEKTRVLDVCRKGDINAFVLVSGAIYKTQATLNGLKYIKDRFERISNQEVRLEEIESLRKDGVIMQLIKDDLVNEAVKIRLGW